MLTQQQCLIIRDKAISRSQKSPILPMGPAKVIKEPKVTQQVSGVSVPVLHCSSLSTYSSALRSRESHHTSLATGSRRTWGSRATILTSGTLRMRGTRVAVRTKVHAQEGGGDT